MTTPITKERLEQALANPTKITFNYGEALELARIALAAMEAEPVGYYRKGSDGFYFASPTEKRPGTIPLYTALPAPSFVPDEVLNRLEHEANTVTAWHHMDEYSCKVNRRDLLTLVNACRAAMLQSEPVSETYKLNSPVIPDGWIPVSERMPDKTGPYWCWFGKEKPSVIQQRVMMFDGRWNIFNDDSVTHWMPLPAAPQQGVK